MSECVWGVGGSEGGEVGGVVCGHDVWEGCIQYCTFLIWAFSLLTLYVCRADRYHTEITNRLPESLANFLVTLDAIFAPPLTAFDIFPSGFPSGSLL